MKNDEGTPKKKKSEEDHPAAFLGGGAAGAVAGAAVGSLGGPVGTVAGATVGGFAGAMAGESLAELPEEDDQYWRKNFSSRPYASDDKVYEDYRPAYSAGYRGYCAYGSSGRSFDEVEEDIKRGYETGEHRKYAWSEVRGAARDSYDRTSQLREEAKVEGTRHGNACAPQDSGDRRSQSRI